MSCNFGQIWLVTSGGCTPSTTSARTVIAMSRLRRHRIGSSWAASIFATRVRGCTVARGDGEIADMAQVEPLGWHGAGDHADLLDAVAHGGDRRAGDQH